MRSKLTGVRSSTVLILLLASSGIDAAANTDMACRSPDGGNVFAVWVTVGFFQVETVDVTTRAALFVEVGRRGDGAHAVVKDGLSNTVFFAEKHVVCADADGDGFAGITAVRLTLGSGRQDPADAVTILILPSESTEIDEPGWHPATAEISGGGLTLQMEGTMLAVATGDGSLR
jgi:hypothetical protein